MTGKIKLVDKAGKIIHEKEYKDRSGRNAIVDKWKKIYGKGIEKYYLHILPNIENTNTFTNGTNRKPDRLRIY